MTQLKKTAACPMPPISVADLAMKLNATAIGHSDIMIDNLAPFTVAKSTSLSFFDAARRPALIESLRTSQAGAILVKPEDQKHCISSIALVVDHPRLCFATLASELYKPSAWPSGIHPSSVIDATSYMSPSARIGASCVIGADVVIGDRVRLDPGCIIGDGVHIGDDTHVRAHVTIEHGVRIGQRCHLYASCVIGSDGFGHVQNGEGEWTSMPQLGSVIIGDDVRIGAQTCIDRGALADTFIDEGVKIDNLVQVGHNVSIGAHTAIAGCVGIAGSARLGAYCQIGGGSLINGHIHIADRAIITAASVVMSSIKDAGVYSSASLLQSNWSWRKNTLRMKELDQMCRRISALEKQGEHDE